MVTGTESAARTAWVQSLAFPCTSCVTFGKFPTSSVPQLPHFKMELIMVPMSYGRWENYMTKYI